REGQLLGLRAAAGQSGDGGERGQRTVVELACHDTALVISPSRVCRTNGEGGSKVPHHNRVTDWNKRAFCDSSARAQPAVPADLGLRHAVGRGEIGLDVQERRAVQAIETADRELALSDPQ